jgi:hypothetical protein
VRPPDENQHGSTRPNLLSDARRRFGSDDNILERLERDSARQASGNRSRAAWYAAAASLVLLVLVIVVWMAYENVNTVQVIPMPHPAAERGAPVPTAAAPSGPAEWQLPRGAVREPALPEPAMVLQMDQHDGPLPRPVAMAPVVPSRNNTIANLPPLVLLPGDSAVAKKPFLPYKAEKAQPAEPATRTKPAARTSSLAQQQATPERVAARTTTAGRARKPATVNPAQDAPVDRDVALLSAIIIHDSAHADEKAQFEAASACARASERKCAGRATAVRK